MLFLLLDSCPIAKYYTSTHDFPIYLPIESIPIRFSLRKFGPRNLNSNLGPSCSFFIKPKTSDHSYNHTSPSKFDEVIENSDFDENLI